MGFPAESFALAARPLIDGYAEFVQLRPIPGSGRYGGPGGQLQRGLVTALRALDLIAAGPRSPQPGAPYTYVTTKGFLSVFGFDTLRDLPEIEALEDAGLLSRDRTDDDMPIAATEPEDDAEAEEEAP